MSVNCLKMFDDIALQKELDKRMKEKADKEHAEKEKAEKENKDAEDNKKPPAPVINILIPKIKKRIVPIFVPKEVE